MKVEEDPLFQSYNQILEIWENRDRNPLAHLALIPVEAGLNVVEKRYGITETRALNMVNSSDEGVANLGEYVYNGIRDKRLREPFDQRVGIATKMISLIGMMKEYLGNRRKMKPDRMKEIETNIEFELGKVKHLLDVLSGV